MKEDIRRIESLQEKIKTTWKRLDLDNQKTQVKILEMEMQETDFWQDREKAQQKMKKADNLKQELETWERLRQEVADLRHLAQESESSADHSLNEEIMKNLEELETRFSRQEFTILFGGRHDASNAIVSVHAGTGGVDAQDWAAMLLRMLLRFCEKRGFLTRVMNQSRGQEAGMKSVTFEVTGRYAYGYLKSENGVHRLVRISPFDAEKMRHTSFALVEVLPEIGELEEVVLKDDEIDMEVFRSSGHGGQSVNTTDSAVRLRHKPTGIIVTCQNERSQHQNRAFAMKMLKAKLHKLFEEQRQQEKQKLRGEYSQAEWGNQIRSYVIHPYKQVKDHRTKYESKEPESVLDGDLEPFMEAYLKWTMKK